MFKMKKFLAGLMLMTGGILLGSLNVFASDITVKVANSELEFDQLHVVVQGRTLVPFRAIFETLGAEVEWNVENREVTGTRGDTVVSMTIDEPEMQVNEETIELDVPAQIVNSKTMVPVRAVSDGLDETVSWIADTKTVDIKTSLLYSNDSLKEYINPNWTDEIGLYIGKASEMYISDGAITFDSYLFDYYVDEDC